MEAATAHAPLVRRPRLGRPLSDERIVERLRLGDDVAFEVLYDRYHADLLSFCRHMLGSREEAEDALQHVFVAVHRHLRGSDREVQLRPWLYTVARNRCLSVLRARRQSVALEDVPEPEAAGLAVAAEVENRQDLKDMLADLARVPEDQRAALVLSELGSLSHDEIAEALGVRREKVKALVFQAREALMGWREARQADCREIREQLATLRGGALRRAPIRRHVETCPSCAAFREEVRRQRAAFALVLPVVPSVALKQNVLHAALAGGSAAGAGAGIGAVAGAGAGGAAVAGSAAGGGLGSLGSGLIAKGLVVAAVAASAGSGGYVAVHDLTDGSKSPAPDSQRKPSASPATEVAPAEVVTPVRRGPVQHVPGTPVRRGPVAGSHGRGPQATGDRGKHRGLSRRHGTTGRRPSRSQPSAQGQANRGGTRRQTTATRGPRRTPRQGSPGQRRPPQAARPQSNRGRSQGQASTGGSISTTTDADVPTDPSAVFPVQRSGNVAPPGLVDKAAKGLKKE